MSAGWIALIVGITSILTSVFSALARVWVSGKSAGAKDQKCVDDIASLKNSLDAGLASLKSAFEAGHQSITREIGLLSRQIDLLQQSKDKHAEDLAKLALEQERIRGEIRVINERCSSRCQETD